MQADGFKRLEDTMVGNWLVEKDRALKDKTSWDTFKSSASADLQLVTGSLGVLQQLPFFNLAKYFFNWMQKGVWILLKFIGKGIWNLAGLMTKQGRLDAKIAKEERKGEQGQGQERTRQRKRQEQGEGQGQGVTNREGPSWCPGLSLDPNWGDLPRYRPP